MSSCGGWEGFFGPYTECGSAERFLPECVAFVAMCGMGSTGTEERICTPVHAYVHAYSHTLGWCTVAVEGEVTQDTW